MRFIRQYLKAQYFVIFVTLILKLLGSITDLLLPRILAHMIDKVAPTHNITNIILFGCLMFVISILSLIFNLTGNHNACQVSKNCTQKVRDDLFKKVSSLSSNQIDQISVASLESRLTTDTYNVHNIVGLMLRMGVRAPITIIGGIILSFTMDFTLTLIIIATLPIITLFVYFISKKGIPLFNYSQKVNDKLISKIRENVIGIRVIKALSTKNYEREEFEKKNTDMLKSETKANLVMALSNPSINLILNCGIIIVILLGAYRVNIGRCEPGAILAFITYFTIISNAMLSITRIFVQLAKAAASVERIEEVLDLEEDLSLDTSLNINKSEDYISFKNVDFSYPDTNPQLHNINFSINKGDTLGIIGATGSGKSTLILLLMRFYDIDTGEILINGKNVKQIPHSILNSMFGITFQNDYLVNDTIYENVSFGRDLSMEQVKKACQIAQAEDFINSYKDKYMHKLSIKGSNLSGGQKQRILIARAIAGEPDILVLDDSSSALDYKTDALVRSKLKEQNNTTTIIIAQRISSIFQSDKIIVLDKGYIAGIGTHDYLLEHCDIYKEIYNIQT